MNRYCFAISVSLVTVLLGATAMASEFGDGTIVVSDGWCAPTSTDCNKCDSGRLVTGANCNNTYCDNMVYQCGAPPFVQGVQTTMAGSVFIVNEFDSTKNYGWTSDEHGETSQIAVCPVGYAMVGMFSSSSFSDNIRTRCQQVSRSGGWGSTTITVSRGGFISDEWPYDNWQESGAWLSGASCTGDFCDNMYYWYTTLS